MNYTGTAKPSRATQSRVRVSGRGFTLVEVVVALFIVLVLAAVALPNVTGFLQQKRVDATADLLTEIAAAIVQFNTDVKNTNPGRLSELSNPIVSGNASYATGSDNSCGTAFDNGDRDDWAAFGPFVNFLISRDSGMVTPIGLARDSLTRSPNNNAVGVLIINFINSVGLPDAKLLDEKIDASDGKDAGSVRWIEPAVNGNVTMFYRMPVDNKC